MSVSESVRRVRPKRVYSDDPIECVGLMPLPVGVSEDVSTRGSWSWTLVIKETGSGRCLEAEGIGGTALNDTRVEFRRQISQDFGLDDIEVAK